MSDYDFDEILFTPIYWRLLKSKTRFVINYGGTGSSKSYSMWQFAIRKMLTEEYNYVVVRKVAASIQNSCYDNILSIIKIWGLEDKFKWAYSGDIRYIQNRETGAKMLFKGMDDPEKIKSIFGIKRIIIEEANQLSQEDFMELNRRVRGMAGIQIFLLFNPILETHWIRDYFFNGRENTTIIHSTYKDNPFLTLDDINEIENLKNIDINQYNVYALGMWGKPGVKRPFAFGFTDEHIATGLDFDYKYPVYLSFDFNVDPITCTASQIWPTKWHIIREYRLPESDIYQLCDEIRNTFRGTVYFKVTGDSTGMGRSAMTKGHSNYYQIIKSELKITNTQFDVPAANPSIKDTRALMITLLREKGFEFRVDSSCHYTIDDLRYVEVDENGELMKKEAEKEGMGHLLDTVRYTAFRYFNKFLKHSLAYRLQNK
jgi:phage terminase large subunit